MNEKSKKKKKSQHLVLFHITSARSRLVGKPRLLAKMLPPVELERVSQEHTHASVSCTIPSLHSRGDGLCFRVLSKGDEGKPLTQRRKCVFYPMTPNAPHKRPPQNVSQCHAKAPSTPSTSFSPSQQCGERQICLLFVPRPISLMSRQ
ncbi:hypothetical protein CEXT_218811 [Caerostris extrusa]|uniref:Uncharacterized protein n=1 Tax=Caerostris extrusa TaxID=172846 RepID=A0AAV4VLK6_CAEEX|nr:hypothetical protein CEXT_218811 [Caerostris extrusa]